ncbi:MAG TPA: SbmA/BacA-like family transporter [Rhizomicrobium sp.]|jgi:putative ATP-binding cassette transporter
MFTDKPQRPAISGEAGLVSQVAMMMSALLSSPVRNTLLMLGGAIFAIVVLTTYGQIRLNQWNQPFYDALERRNFHGFMIQMGVFCTIAGGLLVLNVAQRWLAEALKLKLREGLARDLVGEWLEPNRAFRLAKAGPVGVNPDQRMHEDARHLTELSGDLGVQLLQSTILLITFISVLWGISGSFRFDWYGHAYAIPGYMVWAAVVYAGSGSLLSWWVGSNLVARNADRYQRESELRVSLVRTNEHIEAIENQPGGIAQAQAKILGNLKDVLTAMWRLVNGVTNLTWVTAGYGWLTLVAPILVAAPAYFSGSISFGGLMMAVGAFNQVQQSLRWFVDNFSTIADWRATLLRVAEFRRALLVCDELKASVPEELTV